MFAAVDDGGRGGGRDMSLELRRRRAPGERVLAAMEGVIEDWPVKQLQHRDFLGW